MAAKTLMRMETPAVAKSKEQTPFVAAAEAGPAEHASGHAHHHEHGKASESPAASEHSYVRDPVCGMTVDPHSTAYSHPHGGRTYYFCSAGCRNKFAADPEKYAGPAQRQ